MRSWENLIEIDRTWITKQLNHLFQDIDVKVNINLYCVKPSGTKLSILALADELHYMLPDYVYGKKKRKEMGDRKAALTANHFFGKKDPKTDGKYGELLLFALVESVLGCKMIAHKIRSITNFSDQVKGGDGVFLGNYSISDGRLQPALLIGESKVMGSYSDALKDALVSLSRFCDAASDPEFLSTELVIAKENLNLGDEMDLDELYNRLTPSTSEYKEQILVLPVLLMFNSKGLKNCEDKCMTAADLENEIHKLIHSKKARFIKSIKDKLAEYREVRKMHLHFFLLPCTNVDEFRNTLYYKIHGVSHS